jgi:hypothetical protein
MKKVIILFVAILLVSGFELAAKLGNDSEANAPAAVAISGTVVDQLTGEGLAGATVSVDNTNIKTFTDFEGNFYFNSLAVGTYDLKVTYISYQETNLENLQVAENSKGIEVKMKANGNE